MSHELEDLLLHPKTRMLLENFISNPSHALLITGQAGAGKRQAAKAVASKLLGLVPEALESYPYFLRIYKSDGEKEISIDTIRELKRKLQLKTIGTSPIRRVVLIEDGHAMSHEAQNALLKILEEPSVDTVFIVISPSENQVLPTIASRAQIVLVYPVSLTQAKEYFLDPAEIIERAWRLSGGYAGLLSALLDEGQPHALKDAVNLAKNLIRQEPYERLLTLDNISNDKSQLFQALDALNRVITSLHHNAVHSGNKLQQQRLLSSRKLIKQVQSSLETNANPRLATAYLAINLSV